MKTITDAYISIDLNNDQLASIAKRIERALQNWGLPVMQAKASAHVSIAYAASECQIERLEQLVQKMAQEGFETQLAGIEIFEGHTTPYDYIALSLADTGDFRAAVELVSENIKVKRFQGGFKGHITLFQIEKGRIPQAAFKNLGAYLEAASGGAGQGTVVTGDSVSVFNGERVRQLQVPLHAPLRQAV